MIDSGLEGRPDLNPTAKGKPARILYSASFLPATINGGAIIDHEAPLKRRFVAVQK